LAIDDNNENKVEIEDESTALKTLKNTNPKAYIKALSEKVAKNDPQDRSTEQERVKEMHRAKRLRLRKLRQQQHQAKEEMVVTLGNAESEQSTVNDSQQDDDNVDNDDDDTSEIDPNGLLHG